MTATCNCQMRVRGIFGIQAMNKPLGSGNNRKGKVKRRKIPKLKFQVPHDCQNPGGAPVDTGWPEGNKP